LYARHGWMMSC